ncbi:MAG: UDP-N-acetylglucosamine 2-epimerase [Lachnotalea sp.]
MKTIGVVTGSRAEYGLLRPVLKRIKEDEELNLQIIVTGMHLDDRCGMTYKEIEEDGFIIKEKVEMNVASDTAIGTCKSMGLGMIGLSEAYERVKPDMILLLGDRYEIFVAASVATICKIPIAHIHGGEITQGAYDDCMRHAITKMSYLHFTSTKEYRKRVIQLGEEPDRVFEVGALGIENIKETKLLSKHSLEKSLKISLANPYILVTFHPITLEKESTETQIEPLFEALDSFLNLTIIFTKSNSDTGGNIINARIEEYVAKNKERAVVFSSLGSLRYLSLLSYSRAVIGNSSSGIIEAPFLSVSAVDIGDRQRGRVKPSSVISCENQVQDIIDAIHKTLTYNWKKEDRANPYEKEGTSNQMIEAIKQTLDYGINLKKNFYDLEGES